MGGGDAPSPPPYSFALPPHADLALAPDRRNTGPMLGIAFGAAALAASVAAQAGTAPPEGQFTAAELRVMCRGESAENPRFRTRAGYEMLAEYQRAKCRMYLLGVADGIGWHQAGGRACAPGAAERERLADQLVEAMLQPPATPDGSVRGIVAAALILHPPCR